MRNILYIHQSAELYGSDKTLLYLVSEIAEKGFHPIVVLPNHGPLEIELQKAGIEIIVAPVIKVSRKMFSAGNLMTLPFQSSKSFRIIRKALNGRKIHMVHSNTLAVLVGALYAKRYRIKHLWHVHEIVTHPKVIADLYPKLVDKFSNIVAFNSKATMDFMVAKNPGIAKKSIVVLNGFDRTDTPLPDEGIENFRKTVFDATADDLVIGLVGRISRWKGQGLLLNSFSNLAQKHGNIRLVFVGSAPPNQENFTHALEEKIAASGFAHRIKIIPFRTDIWNIWDALDIAAVPSTEPEPFGLVAIEAMLASKPVIGANHGGLTEIIIDNQTGFLFTPNDESSLTVALETLVTNAGLREEFGAKGKARAISAFSLARYVSDFADLYR